MDLFTLLKKQLFSLKVVDLNVNARAEDEGSEEEEAVRGDGRAVRFSW